MSEKPRIILADPSRTCRLIFCEMLRNSALPLQCWDCATDTEARRLTAEPRNFCIFAARYFDGSDGLALCADALAMDHCVGAVLLSSDTLLLGTASPIRLLAKPFTALQLAQCLIDLFVDSPGSLPAPIASSTFARGSDYRAARQDSVQDFGVVRRGVGR